MKKEIALASLGGIGLVSTSAGLGLAIANKIHKNNNNKINKLTHAQKQALTEFKTLNKLPQLREAASVTHGSSKIKELEEAINEQAKASKEYINAKSQNDITVAISRMERANNLIKTANSHQEIANEKARLDSDQNSVINSINSIKLDKEYIMFGGDAEMSINDLTSFNYIIGVQIKETSDTKITSISSLNYSKGLKVTIIAKTIGATTETKTTVIVFTGFVTASEYKVIHRLPVATTVDPHNLQLLNDVTTAEAAQNLALSNYMSAITNNEVDNAISDMLEANENMNLANAKQLVHERTSEQQSFISSLTEASKHITEIAKTSTADVISKIINSKGLLYDALVNSEMIKETLNIHFVSVTSVAINGNVKVTVVSRTSRAETPVKTTVLTLTGFNGKDTSLIASVTRAEIKDAIKAKVIYDKNTEVDKYSFPTSVLVNGVDVTLTKLSEDIHSGSLMFSASLSKGVGTPKTFSRIGLSGFKTSKTDKEKIDSISEALSHITGDIDSHMPSSLSLAIGETKLNEILHSIVHNSYGIIPTFASQVSGDGVFSFVVSYTLGTQTASHTIRLDNFQSYEKYKRNHKINAVAGLIGKYGVATLSEVLDLTILSKAAVENFNSAITPGQVDFAIAKIKEINKKIIPENVKQVKANLDGDKVNFKTEIESVVRGEIGKWTTAGEAFNTGGTWSFDSWLKRNNVNSFHSTIKLGSFSRTTSGRNLTYTFTILSSFGPVHLAEEIVTKTVTDFFLTNAMMITKYKSTHPLPLTLDTIQPVLSSAFVAQMVEAKKLQSNAKAKFDRATTKQVVDTAISEMNAANTKYKLAEEKQKVDNAKNKAKAIIAAITLPTKDEAHNPALFVQIQIDHDNAIKAINAATTVREVRREVTQSSGTSHNALTVSILNYISSFKKYSFNGKDYLSLVLAQAALAKVTTKLDVFIVTGGSGTNHLTENDAIAELYASKTKNSMVVYNRDIIPSTTSFTDISPVSAAASKTVFTMSGNTFNARPDAMRIDKSLDATIKNRKLAKNIITDDSDIASSHRSLDLNAKANKSDIDTLAAYYEVSIEDKNSGVSDRRFLTIPNSEWASGTYAKYIVNNQAPRNLVETKAFLNKFATLGELKTFTTYMENNYLSAIRSFGDIDPINFWSKNGAIIPTGPHGGLSQWKTKGQWDLTIDNAHTITDIENILAIAHSQNNNVPSTLSWVKNAQNPHIGTELIRSSIIFTDGDAWNNDWKNLTTKTFHYIDGDKTHAFETLGDLEIWFGSINHQEIVAGKSASKVIVEIGYWPGYNSVAEAEKDLISFRWSRGVQPTLPSSPVTRTQNIQDIYN